MIADDGIVDFRVLREENRPVSIRLPHPCDRFLVDGFHRFDEQGRSTLVFVRICDFSRPESEVDCFLFKTGEQNLAWCDDCAVGEVDGCQAVGERDIQTPSRAVNDKVSNLPGQFEDRRHNYLIGSSAS